MIKNGEVYQIGEHKYLIVSNKGNHYIGCILSDNDKRKTTSDISYYIPNYGYVCCEYIKTLNTEDLINKVGKIDNYMLVEIKSIITKIIMGNTYEKNIKYIIKGGF